MKDRVLVVDDETYVSEFISQVLSDHYEVFVARDGREALEKVSELKPALIVLDILMKGMDGIATCRALRSQLATSEIPILMLTALNETEQRIEAFSAGADDYLAKPFKPEELLVRVAVKIKRARSMRALSQKANSLYSLEFADISMHLQDLTVTIDGDEFALGSVEFKILNLLMRNQGQIVSREEIESFVWGDATPSKRALDPHITSLRKKLRLSRGELKTVYGSGYGLVERSRAT